MGAHNPIQTRALRSAKPMNEVVKEAMLQALEEVCRLANEGHTVISADVAFGRPRIQLAASPLLAHLVETGKAAYYTYAIREGKRTRQGQLHNRSCTVVWAEENVA